MKSHISKSLLAAAPQYYEELEQRDLDTLQKYKSRAAKESSPATAIIPVDAIESRGNDVQKRYYV